MTRKQLKKYNTTKRELKEIGEQIEKETRTLENLYFGNDQKAIDFTSKRLNRLLNKRCELIAYKEKVILPEYFIIENGVQDVNEYLEDNDMGKDFFESILEEYVSMNLTDTYNHSIYGFNWAIKDNTDDIYVTKIRWYKNQLLKDDIKDILRKRLDGFENRQVAIYRDPFISNRMTIKDKASGFYVSKTYKDAIKYLEMLKAI